MSGVTSTIVTTIIVTIVVAALGLTPAIIIPFFLVALLVVALGPVSRFIRERGAGGSPEPQGVPTTREASIDILRTEAFQSGRYSTSFLEEAWRQLPALAS